MADPSPKGTPKRKRGDVDTTTPSPIKFTFDIANTNPGEDGSGSPRSIIAHKFHGLALGSTSEPAAKDAEPTDSIHKRAKPEEAMCTALADARLDDTAGRTEKPASHPDTVLASTETAHSGYSHITSSTVTLPEQPKPKRKRRTGTPPLRFRKGPILEQKDGAETSDEEAEIVDPVRAALTWHDDEITIYDPDDEDDDGTGINGIGFKPTPALAHARAMKRKQQMADYRKREDSEARARRSLRRRGAGTGMAADGGDENKSPRKVRFMEAERQNIAVTTG